MIELMRNIIRDTLRKELQTTVEWEVWPITGKDFEQWTTDLANSIARELDKLNCAGCPAELPEGGMKDILPNG